MKCLILACALAAGAATAQVPWFTVVGNPEDPNVDTIQINPIAVSERDATRIMELRVSRSHERSSQDRVRFRSFRGLVEFNCDAMTARFVRSQFYHSPLWTDPGPELRYPADTVRRMDFRLFEPNPRDRVIRAACHSR